jgi:hypothetical protein
VKINIEDGETAPVSAGAGVKLLPAVLPSGEIGYLRRDNTAGGVFYSSGKAGPKGWDLRTPSWSPDGGQVVYSRFVAKRPVEPMKVWSKNPQFDLYRTAWLPAYDPSGEHLAARRRRTVGDGEEGLELGGFWFFVDYRGLDVREAGLFEHGLELGLAEA